MKDYKIINFIPETGQVIIKYRDYQPMAVDLPLDENNNVPTGEELEHYLKGFIPTWHFERLEKLKSGILNADEIASLVEPEEIITPTVDLLANCKATAKMLLFETDYSLQPDVKISNKSEFEVYRALIRQLYLNPVEDPVWPQVPSPQWIE